MKKKVCKKCKLFVDASQCPDCKTDQFSNSWQGRLSILDPSKSNIAKKIGITTKGDYAIKSR